MSNSLRLGVCARIGLWFLACLPAAIAGADTQSPNGSEQEVWLISTRESSICGACEQGHASVLYWQLTGDDWAKRTVKDFHNSATARNIPTTFFVHGNRFDADGAIDAATHVYCQLRDAAAGKPFRMVIWAWPSDRIRGGNRRDVRAKACRADYETFYFASCLNEVPRNVPLTLIGYSFGARIVTGALHLQGGGTLGGQTVPSPSGKRTAGVNTVLVAAALDADWLLPGHCHDQALGQVDRMVITQNRCDTALRWYQYMYRLRGPHALGFVGPVCLDWLNQDRDKIEVLGLSCAVGRTHDWACYASVSTLQERFRTYGLAGANVATASHGADRPTHALAMSTSAIEGH